MPGARKERSDMTQTEQRTVLVVDDHEATSRLLGDALISWGFEVQNYDSIETFQQGG